MQLNLLVEIAAEEWERTAIIRRGVTIDTFIVMPNHLHGIVILAEAIDQSGGIDRAHRSATLHAHCDDPHVRHSPSVAGLPFAQSVVVQHPPLVGAHCGAPGLDTATSNISSVMIAHWNGFATVSRQIPARGR